MSYFQRQRQPTERRSRSAKNQLTPSAMIPRAELPTLQTPYQHPEWRACPEEKKLEHQYLRSRFRLCSQICKASGARKHLTVSTRSLSVSSLETRILPGYFRHFASGSNRKLFKSLQVTEYSSQRCSSIHRSDPILQRLFNASFCILDLLPRRDIN
jgi:hypothetical protein